MAREHSGARGSELELAVSFALLMNHGGAQPWMRWSGWVLHIGCDHCVSEGKFASCWERAACHGYDRGCGCSACTQQQVLAEALSDRAAPVSLGGADIVALRRELADVDAQIGSPDRRAG